jgi:hypothetical protein
MSNVFCVAFRLRQAHFLRETWCIQCLFLTLTIEIYILKSLGSVNDLFSRNF